MKLEAVIETALYTDDLDAMQEFYQHRPGLDLTYGAIGRSLFFKICSSMLIIFDRCFWERS